MQQGPIPPAHHAISVGNEPSRPTPTGIVIPIGLVTSEPKQHLGDASVACAMLVRIQCAQRQGMKFPDPGRHLMEGGKSATVVQRAPDAPRRVGAQFEEGIHRQDSDQFHRPIGQRVRQAKLMVNPFWRPDTMPTSADGSKIKVREIAQCIGYGRFAAAPLRYGEVQGFGEYIRHPKGRIAIRRNVRIMWEIGHPSGA